MGQTVVRIGGTSVDVPRTVRVVGATTTLCAVDHHGWLAAPGVGLSTVWKSPAASGTRA